jgi:predicted RNA-binding Zn-ribbon protein involved in translation (DUF1610 family)
MAPAATSATYSLVLGRVDLRRALRLLKPSRQSTARAQGELQLGFNDGEALFCLPARQTRCKADGYWPGLARFSFRHALLFGTFKNTDPVARIEFLDGYVRLETLKVPATFVRASDLVAGLSMDAHFLEALDEESQTTAMFCPRCGKRTGVRIEELEPSTGGTPTQKQLQFAEFSAGSAYECGACGYRWAALPPSPGGR